MNRISHLYSLLPFLYLYLYSDVIPRYMFGCQRESKGKAERVRIGSSVKCNTQHHGIQSEQTEERKWHQNHHRGMQRVSHRRKKIHFKRVFTISTNIHNLQYDVIWFIIVWHLPAKNKFDFWWLMRQWTCTRQEHVTSRPTSTCHVPIW